MPTERLQKIMAHAGVASRRQSEELILRGLVRVDGKVVREMGVKVDPLVNSIEVMGEPISVETARTYVALNKPRGFLTTVSDPFGRPTVMKLLDANEPNIFPVGRLDLNSEGLLLLTNDGDLAFRLTHPKHSVLKTYEVVVRGLPNTAAIWMLRKGVFIEGGPTRPAVVRIKEKSAERTKLEMTIKEGRKRQVRRMCQVVGHHVLSLKRVLVGPIELGDLKPGESRHLTREEIADLNRAVGRV
ncbi:MAG TPA: rRNA pseudouridine synthase [Actinobacteria bacterium]|nr:rRNA pseudouridine synthase [Actinomycetota bacterium]